MSNTPNRYSKLDGLRGILSLIVALNHSFLVVAIPSFANVWGQNYLEFHDLQSKIQQLLMILGNGGAAVSAFFILSGFVLGQSLSRVEISIRGLVGFYLKRIIRLYPVYAFVIIITALYMKFGFVYQTFPAASTWYHWWMNFPVDLREFLSNVFFVHISLGGVTWTLRVIVIASFIFPAFYLLTKKTPWLVDLVLTAILVYLSFTLLNIPGFRDLRYMYMFFFGLMIPKFQRLFSAIPGWLIALYLPVALILIFCIRYSTDEYFGGLVETVATWPIIGLLIYSEKTKLFDFLNKNVLQFFGKISYSLYLIHFSILYVMARFMFQLLPNLPYTDHYLLIHTILFVSSLSVATLVSMLVYRFVEIPSVTAAKVVGHKISGE